MADANFKELKKGGFMKQKQKDRFSMRLKTIGGQMTIQQLETIRHVAGTYGHGYIHLTSRQGIEIPFIALEDIDTVKKRTGKRGRTERRLRRPAAHHYGLSGQCRLSVGADRYAAHSKRM